MIIENCMIRQENFDTMIIAVSLKDVSLLKIADKLTKFYGSKRYSY